MFERFTEGARQVVELARQEARDLGFPDVGTEHLLLALMRSDKNLLEPTGMDIDRVRGEIERIAFPVAERRVKEPLPFAPGSKLAFQLASQEARNLEHVAVAEGHLFLALLSITDGFAARALVNLGLSLEELRKHALKRLASGSAPDDPVEEVLRHSPGERVDDDDLVRMLGLPPPPSEVDLGEVLFRQQVGAAIEEILRVKRLKLEATRAEDFEAAARHRDREQELRRDLEERIRRWNRKG